MIMGFCVLQARSGEAAGHKGDRSFDPYSFPGGALPRGQVPPMAHGVLGAESGFPPYLSPPQLPLAAKRSA
jgi:hypothetical protein